MLVPCAPGTYSLRGRLQSCQLTAAAPRFPPAGHVRHALPPVCGLAWRRWGAARLLLAISLIRLTGSICRLPLARRLAALALSGRHVLHAV